MLRDPRAVRRRLHRLLVDADPPHPEDHARGRHRHRRAQAPRRRPVGRRRLRIEARTSTPRRRCASSSRNGSTGRCAGARTARENALATIHGRGMIQDIELAADADGRIAAVRVRLVADMGAYLQLVTPGIPLLGAFLYTGVYDIPALLVHVHGVFTNRTPTDAYRGAGRPEATYAIERAIDVLAREVGIDPAEIRRRNFIATDKFPYTSAGTLVFDSGDYAPALDEALRAGRATTSCVGEQASRRAAGDTKHLGIGFSSYVEMCGLGPEPGARRRSTSASGGWEHAVDPRPAHGQGPGRHRHDSARPGPRDVVVDDRRRPSRRADRRRRGPALRHRDLAPRSGHLRLALARRRRHRDLRGLREGDRQGPRDRRSPDGGRRGGPRVRRRASSGSAARRRARCRSRRSRSRRSPRTTCPTASSPTSTAEASYDPSNFTFPFGVHIAVVEVDEETGRRRPRALRRRRRLRQPDQPADRRGPGARRHRAGRGAGAVGGGRLRRATGSLAHVDARRLPRPVGRRGAEPRARPHRHAQPVERAGRQGQSARRGRSRPRRP